jgi:hypothetical protein
MNMRQSGSLPTEKIEHRNKLGGGLSHLGKRQFRPIKNARMPLSK